MKNSSDSNNPGLKEGDRFGGYRVKRVVELEEISSFFYELEHAATGARHIHVSNSDKENVFSVAFKTVPEDSTGVAHILEHTVLCGSKKFPVRDPFFSMLKRSLNTFMNAFTASDWTMYPFCTQNRKDFYNLMTVYLDSVFSPKLDEVSFKQEGHRLEIDEDAEGPDPLKMTYKGVVYNEMKGAMSSPDQVMVRSMFNALYPATTYRHNSGGDPSVIPRLTYEQLKAFHKRHYHPSNAFFYTYGKLALRDHLLFIEDNVLKGFDHTDPKTDVPSQPRWRRPKEVTYPYPFGQNEDPLKKCQVCVAWLTADIQDAFEVLALTLLEQILLGNAASPLRKALMDSGLGTALCDGAGFVADNRDTLFAAGLKDVEKSAAGKIETIIFETLESLVQKGIDKNLIESAIHQIEFHRKEVTNHPYPYGIKLLISFSGNWLHGGDPVRTLKFDVDLERLRNALLKGPFFEDRIKEYFLDNSHRILLTLVPDRQMEQKENERMTAEIARIRTGMRPSDLGKIKEDAVSLKKLQETPEDVSSLPTLELEDIPPSVQIIAETVSHEKTPAACYLQPTAGIFYFTAAAGSGALAEHLIPLVPFFCHAFSRIGTAKRDYVEMARLIDMYTGGISLSANARTRFGESDFEKPGACIPFVSLNGKCLVRNQSRMFDLIEELLFSFDFSDLARLKTLLLEYRAGMESMIVQNGHRLAMSLASRNFSRAAALDEIWHGIHQLQTIKAITRDLADDKLKAVSDDLTAIGKTVLVRKNVKMALMGEESTLPAAVSSAASLQQGLKEGAADGFSPPEINLNDVLPREGWGTASAVSFVARTFETVRMEHENAPALSVIGKMLRSLYLHREIREKGGAYGGYAIYNSEGGLFCFASYRDPHIVSTLNVFDKAAAFIRSGDCRNEDIKEAILQVCSEIDKPDSPGPAARKAFFRKIVCLSDETRNCFKERLLTLTRGQVLQVAEKYFQQNAKNHAVAVISGEQTLKAANEKLLNRPLTLYRI